MIKLCGIFYNDKAGHSKAGDIAGQFAAAASKQGIQCTFITAPSVEEAITAVAKATHRDDALVAIGGDGTLNLVATAFLRAKKTVPLGIIPGGTVNNLAHQLGMPPDVPAAIQVILDAMQREQTESIGIGQCGDHAFVSSLVFGALADISNQVRQQEKRKFGPIVYVAKGLKLLVTNRSYRISMRHDGQEETSRVWTGLVTTTNGVGRVHYIADDDSDLLHVSLLHHFRWNQVLTYIRYFLSGHFDEMKGVTYFTTEKLALAPVNPKRTIRLRLDGDKGPALPMTIRWRPRFLPVLITKKQ
ncbi:diacylglycerol/lipid kinase family protein [Schleiferilactobacillus perolens]|uniref:Transcription regulator n=1 Tax=Schleiferilactobacillus perolens DSM 12744 TaxID=1423792 RepID=A0A0R1NAD9_9LACO|nr:diacylglycerol kinase family protein [Schleiferilactobacillus perolens]KRL13384.1 transcription regulator [Schleiferilactobacillus perolens DSM 12744]